MESPKVSAHGLAVFGALRAEDEPWLEECFVPPAEFDLMGGAPSAIVFGPPGIGKSAVRAMLVRRAGGRRASSPFTGSPILPYGNRPPDFSRCLVR